MGKVGEKLVVAVTTSELIRLGYLVDVEASAPSEPDLTGFKVVAGQWDDNGDRLQDAITFSASVMKACSRLI